MTTKCTIYKNIFDKNNPYYITVDEALARIESGKSKSKVDEIREQLSKERADKLKCNLPSVCFSGEFTERYDDKIKKHSGFIVLDFDNVENVNEKKEEIINNDFVYACWISPRGNGLKALVKIANGKKHREHFQALQEVFREIDKSGINESRVCFESYDREIYINKSAKPFTKLKKIDVFEEKIKIDGNAEIFDRILKWLSNRGDAFVTGERNMFIFKLASACCRFGIDEDSAYCNIRNALNLSANNFSEGEAIRTVKSSYKANKNKYGSACFVNDILVEKESRSEIKIDTDIYDEAIRPKDVIFGEDVKDEALKIFEFGYEQLKGIGYSEFDSFFKLKAGELTLLSGIGNYGKSTFWQWFLLMRVILYGEKFAFFSPENNPASEFYHDFVEIIIGADCTPYNYEKISRSKYEAAYDFVSKHIFYVYPKEALPTPDYIKERFFELVIKEKISGCVIDPFNQLANNYKSAGGRSDKYLEDVFSNFLRFSQINNLFFAIVAHPHKLSKDATGNYPCPDVFDIADGAMWNNKMDNILIYHRPMHQKDPQSAICELHTKKIRRQKTVGKKGVFEFQYYRKQRRFFFDGRDVMQYALNNKNITFLMEQSEMDLEEAPF